MKYWLLKNKIVFANFMANFIGNMLNIVIPLIVFPLILQKTNFSILGLIGFFSAIYSFIMFFMDYGYGITGIKKLTQYHHSEYKKNYIINKILTIKTILFIFLSIFFLLFMLNIFYVFDITMDKLNLSKDDLIKTIVLTFILTFSTIFHPFFVFNSLKIQYTYSHLFNLFKVFSLIMILSYVVYEQNIKFYIIFFLFFVHMIFSDLFLIYFYKKYKYKFYFVLNKTVIFKELKSNFYYFNSIFFISSINFVWIIFISFFFGLHITGLYSLVEKLINMLKMISYSLTLVTYHKNFKSLQNLKTNNEKLKFVYSNIIKMFFICGPITIISYISLYFLYDIFIYFKLINNMKDYLYLETSLKLLFVTPLLYGLFLPIQTYFFKENIKLFVKLVVYSFIFSISINFLFHLIFKNEYFIHLTIITYNFVLLLYGLKFLLKIKI